MSFLSDVSASGAGLALACGLDPFGNRTTLRPPPEVHCPGPLAAPAGL